MHRERPFFKDLVRFMTSGPVMVQVLEGEGAIAKNREVMGATDPKKANKGTIRADLATSIDENIVHGSDAADTAAKEISYFFREIELYSSAATLSGEVRRQLGSGGERMNLLGAAARRAQAFNCAAPRRQTRSRPY